MSSLAMLKIVEKQNAQLREQNRVLASHLNNLVEWALEVTKDWTVDDDSTLANDLRMIWQAQAAITATSQPAQPAQGGAKCVWVDDEGGIYQTGCKHAFMVDPDSDEPPIWIKFCCYCGSLVEFFVPAAEGETRA